ncbi:MAG TPA: class I SAM-dependent methyltransferase [Solirubrobacterales bacterium]|nr:class I SAM-dependent methyltransferase [Solirubrobacterales bacterium]
MKRFLVEAVRRGAARRGYALVRGEDVVAKPGPGEYDLVRRSYDSPIPQLEELPADVCDRRSALAGGIELNVERAIETIETELAPYVAELDFPLDGPRPPGEFFLRKENYQSVDAELLYAIVRARRPRRVLELGSGYTTLLIGMAARRNAEEGTATEHVAYDPFPRRQVIGDAPPSPSRLEPVSAVDVPLQEFRKLEAGDVLFVDTTHTVKLGSDVNYIVLDVLPALAPGVIVHFHDVFLPWEYPRVWLEEMGYYWSEQYLLQAFLAFNDEFEVLIPAHAVAREHPERLAAAVPTFSPPPGRLVGPAAFWISRR